MELLEPKEEPVVVVVLGLPNDELLLVVVIGELYVLLGPL